MAVYSRCYSPVCFHVGDVLLNMKKREQLNESCRLLVIRDVDFIPAGDRGMHFKHFFLNIFSSTSSLAENYIATGIQMLVIIFSLPDRNIQNWPPLCSCTVKRLQEVLRTNQKSTQTIQERFPLIEQ